MDSKEPQENRGSSQGFHLLCPSQKQPPGKGPGGVFPASEVLTSLLLPTAPSSAWGIPNWEFSSQEKDSVKAAFLLLNQAIIDEKAAEERKGQLECARKKCQELGYYGFMQMQNTENSTWENDSYNYFFSELLEQLIIKHLPGQREDNDPGTECCYFPKSLFNKSNIGITQNKKSLDSIFNNSLKAFGFPTGHTQQQLLCA